MYVCPLPLFRQVLALYTRLALIGVSSAKQQQGTSEARDILVVCTLMYASK